tara:strand:- start:27 stop:539 length:513 start_codon:yes stop_codon:yes gene_type:complete
MKKKGFTIFVTGLPGSGKTTLAKIIKKRFDKKNLPSYEISGDVLRKIFKLNKYDKISRKKYIKMYSSLCKNMNDNGINVIISTVGLFNFIRKWNRKNISRYIEIFVNSNYDINKKKTKKKVFREKKNTWHKNIKVELPQTYDFKIDNFHNKKLEHLLEDTYKKLIKKLNI